MSTVALTDQQRVAVEARGEVVVAAGAGTGKTTLVIERVRAALALGTAPKRMLVVTYTEAVVSRLGDRVTISAPPLGALVNTVRLSTEIAPWTFGVRALYANLAERSLLNLS